MSSAGQKPTENIINEEVWATIELYQSELDDDSELRESIRAALKEIDKAAKKANFVILSMHAKPTDDNLKAIGAKARNMVETSIHPLMRNLIEKIPIGDYYKYNDHWRITFQRLAFVAAAVHYLESGTISSIKDTAALIGVPSIEDKSDTSIFLDYEEYLVGLLEMAAELSRLSRNCITFGDNMAKVYNIHECMNQLSLGLHHITFKNDYLRKRYDGLKYHIKVVEEVIYDLRIRNQGITSRAAEEVASASASAD